MTAAFDDNPHGYPAEIWRLFRDTPRAGRLADGSPGVLVGRAGTPAARSVLELSLKVEAGRITDARFRAWGCPTTIAVGAWLAEAVVGRTLGDLAAVDARQIRAALEIAEARAHCALLGEDVLRAVLTRHQESSS